MNEVTPTFLFASNNLNKLREINSLMPPGLIVRSLMDAGIDIDIPEPFHTLEENARTKSLTIFEKSGLNCFAEDTGLEVKALDGAPGVKSARYAGEHAEPQENIALLLRNMMGKTERSARFRTVVSLIMEGKEYQFEGICRGHITQEVMGESGFGYDSVFIPEGTDKTFAEMNLAEKNKYSHRKKAVVKLLEFLNDWYEENHR